MAIETFLSPTAHELADTSRRSFLKVGAAVGGGLVVGFWSLPASALGAEASAKRFAANGYVTVNPDDTVELTMSRVEMGQGIYTALPMLIAEELEIDLDRVVLRHAPPDVKVYGIPLGDQFTGGSLSVRTLWEPMRQTGAAARMVLVQAAAEGWKVPVDSCFAEHGEVVHRATGRRVKYSRLIEPASKLTAPTKIDLKPASEFKLIGTPVKRLDGKGKTDGSAMFGMDAVRPGMVFASVIASPVAGGKVKSVNDKKTRSMTGVRDVIRLDGAVAVVADNTWYARQGVAALDIVWDEGPNAKVDTESLRTLMVNALDRQGAVARDKGNAADVIAKDPKRFEAVYVNQMLAHAPMEPINCTVHVKPDSAEFWVGTQVPARAQEAAANVLGLPQDKVTINNFLLGGGFGRRLYHDYVEQAAAIGKHVDGPVKVVWTREEDIAHSRHRGLYAHKVSASLDDKGYPIALMHKLAGPSNLAPFAPSWMKNGNIDIDANDGSMNYPYDIANMRTEHAREDGPVPTGFWRGVGPTRNILVLESFMDQLAHKAKVDPLEYRLNLLQTDKRAHNVLTLAAKRAGWGAPLEPRAGRGIALMHAWDTYMAQVVDLTVDDSGAVSVKRVVCVVDCGVVVNPNTVHAQMQGGINFALTAALYSEITIKDGKVQQSNFHNYPMLRMNEAPKIDVEIVKSAEHPGGIGESATAGLGPAFVNAIFSATGKRLFTLPARPDQLKAASAI